MITGSLPPFLKVETLVIKRTIATNNSFGSIPNHTESWDSYGALYMRWHRNIFIVTDQFRKSPKTHTHTIKFKKFHTQVSITVCYKAWTGFKEILGEKSSKVHGISGQYVQIWLWSGFWNQCQPLGSETFPPF